MHKNHPTLVRRAAGQPALQVTRFDTDHLLSSGPESGDLIGIIGPKPGNLERLRVAVPDQFLGWVMQVVEHAAVTVIDPETFEPRVELALGSAPARFIS